MADVEPTDATPPLGFLVASVGQQAMMTFQARMRRAGLHPRAYGVLWNLSRTGPVSQQALSRALGLPASRMVSLVADLRDRGLVSIEPDQADRRIHRIDLTNEGRTTFAALEREAQAVETELTRGLSPADRKTLAELLCQLGSNLDSTGATGFRIW